MLPGLDRRIGVFVNAHKHYVSLRLGGGLFSRPRWQDAQNSQQRRENCPKHEQLVLSQVEN
jgi:hypothetical protein